MWTHTFEEKNSIKKYRRTGEKNQILKMYQEKTC